jgi:hypothetical protein
LLLLVRLAFECLSGAVAALSMVPWLQKLHHRRNQRLTMVLEEIELDADMQGMCLC